MLFHMQSFENSFSLVICCPVVSVAELFIVLRYYVHSLSAVCAVCN